MLSWVSSGNEFPSVRVMPFLSEYTLTRILTNAYSADLERGARKRYGQRIPHFDAQNANTVCAKTTRRIIVRYRLNLQRRINFCDVYIFTTHLVLYLCYPKIFPEHPSRRITGLQYISDPTFTLETKNSLVGCTTTFDTLQLRGRPATKRVLKSHATWHISDPNPKLQYSIPVVCWESSENASIRIKNKYWDAREWPKTHSYLILANSRCYGDQAIWRSYCSCFTSICTRDRKKMVWPQKIICERHAIEFQISI